MDKAYFIGQSPSSGVEQNPEICGYGLHGEYLTDEISSARSQDSFADVSDWDTFSFSSTQKLLTLLKDGIEPTTTATARAP